MDYLLKTIDFLDKMTIVFAFFTMLAVFYNAYANYKQRQKIKIFFLLNGEEIPLGDINIIRKHITRGEILGVLGVLQKNSKERYNIEYLSEKEFFENLYNVQNGGQDELIIKITKEESEQFNISERSML